MKGVKYTVDLPDHPDPIEDIWWEATRKSPEWKRFMARFRRRVERRVIAILTKKPKK